MASDEPTSDESVPPVVPWPNDLTPEETEAFRREDLLKVVDRHARIFVMSGVVLIVFFAWLTKPFSLPVFMAAYILVGIVSAIKNRVYPRHRRDPAKARRHPLADAENTEADEAPETRPTVRR